MVEDGGLDGGASPADASPPPFDAGQRADAPGWDGATWDAGSRDCEGDAYYHRFVFDGRPGATGCVEAAAGMYTYSVPQPQWILTHTAAVAPANDPALRGYPTPPICGAQLRIQIYYDLRWPADRLTGSVAPGPVDESSDNLYVELGVDTAGDPACRSGTGTTLTAIGGSYRVIAGGEPDEVLEIELTDVRFPPFDGHTIYFPSMWWRALVVDQRAATFP